MLKLRSRNPLRSKLALESLANYSSLLWLEKKRGVKEVETVLDGYRFELLEKDAQGKTTAAVHRRYDAGRD